MTDLAETVVPENRSTSETSFPDVATFSMPGDPCYGVDFELSQMPTSSERTSMDTEYNAAPDDDGSMQGRAMSSEFIEEDGSMQGRTMNSEFIEEDGPMQGRTMNREFIEEDGSMQGRTMSRNCNAAIDEDSSMQGPTMSREEIEATIAQLLGDLDRKRQEDITALNDLKNEIMQRSKKTCDRLDQQLAQLHASWDKVKDERVEKLTQSLERIKKSEVELDCFNTSLLSLVHNAQKRLPLLLPTSSKRKADQVPVTDA